MITIKFRERILDRGFGRMVSGRVFVKIPYPKLNFGEIPLRNFTLKKDRESIMGNGSSGWFLENSSLDLDLFDIYRFDLCWLDLFWVHRGRVPTRSRKIKHIFSALKRFRDRDLS